MVQLKEVEVVSTGTYLPGEPVPFNNLESVLGKFEKAPPNIRREERMLRSLARKLIGIDQVYYAIDPKSGEFTENTITMATKAIKDALNKANINAEEIDCLLYGNAVPECQTPPGSTLVQEQLGIEKCAEMEIHSNCSAMSKLLQIAFDSLRLGRYKTVVVAYSQFSSPYLISSYYNQEKLKTENMLLRWFLCDGASALVLKARDKVSEGIRLEYVDNLSIGGKKDKGMWFNLGGVNLDLPRVWENGQHHFGQDYRAANDLGPDCFWESFERLVGGYNLKYSEVDYVLATLPSSKLWEYAQQIFQEKYGISPDKWYGNVRKTGYAGASSVIIALNEMLKKRVLKKSQLVVSVIFESSKWMIGGFILRHV